MGGGTAELDAAGRARGADAAGNPDVVHAAQPAGGMDVRALMALLPKDHAPAGE